MVSCRVIRAKSRSWTLKYIVRAEITRNGLLSEKRYEYFYEVAPEGLSEEV